jgi:hypothetical protein
LTAVALPSEAKPKKKSLSIMFIFG